MGTGIDLFLDWENGIWVAGTGIWPLGMRNEVLKNGIWIEVMRVDSQFFHVLSILKYNFDPYVVSLVMIFVVNYITHSTTCEQAYSGARNSGFSDYACLRMLQMPFPGFKFRNFLCLRHEPPSPTIPIFDKVSATCTHGGLKGLKTVYSTDK
jgi:hypothetical protein